MMMASSIKTLHLDVETFSSVDLGKCGVYKYVESSDFEILLLSYSINEGKVEVVDLAKGEPLPGFLLLAIKDEEVIKYAYNSTFERICLSKFLGYPSGKYLSPKSWRCTMTWSAYLGLPFALRQVGEVLKLDKQKLTEGKDLIRYFCVPCRPTSKNGFRTRNLYFHDKDKWEMFKNYNIRDVETEMEIEKRISKYPVPDFVWDEYHLSEEINDRGVLIDEELVDNAIKIDEETRDRNIKSLQNLTNLENPNSVMQLKNWLFENDVEVDSLGKKEVAHILGYADDDVVKEVLKLRQQVSKSSIKKYLAMKNAKCQDGKVHGMFMFYGANRTGRFCLTGDHEVLTSKGWKKLNEWNDSFIACWNPDGDYVSFQKAKKVEFEYSGFMYHFKDKHIDQVSTPEHKMYAKKRYDGEWGTYTVQEMSSHRPCIPFTGFREKTMSNETTPLRILIMTQADGHFCENGNLLFGFTKERKIERCKKLLRDADIFFTYATSSNGKNPKNKTIITIPFRFIPMWLREFKNKTFDYWLFNENADVFFDELVYWDGYRSSPNSIQYVTCNKQNADLIQAFAHISGRCCHIRIKDRTKEHPNWSIAYYLDIWNTPKNCHEVRNKPEIQEYEGKVYCAITSTGYFLVRRNGVVWVTGNSSKIVQLQNLPQNHLVDLDMARSLVRSGNLTAIETLYDDVSDTLSQLIRTAFIPSLNHKFIVCDFSAIEARVIAWYAGEKWRMESFKNGEDIYCASASKMFHVPVEKHGVNSHLRAKGKIAELALGYGGGVGALKAMGAIEMGLNEDELKPLVDSWRNANPNIVKFWWDIDKTIIQVLETKDRFTYKNLTFTYRGGTLFITLPSGRSLAYAMPKVVDGTIFYMGLSQAKKWERIESYGPKFVENIVQATARDLLVYAMKNLNLPIIMHIHDEVVINAPIDLSVEEVAKKMSMTPLWANGLVLNAAGYECDFYKKD